MPYPPGMSRRDKVRAGIIEENPHDCEFELSRDDSGVVFEDGALYVTAECLNRECNETERFRYDIDHIVKVRGEKELELNRVSEFWLIRFMEETERLDDYVDPMNDEQYIHWIDDSTYVVFRKDAEPIPLIGE